MAKPVIKYKSFMGVDLFTARRHCLTRRRPRLQNPRGGARGFCNRLPFVLYYTPV